MDWEERENPKRLYKAFAFKNFLEALAFAQRVGELAERENHHPRLTVEWGRVLVEWWTHSAGASRRRTGRWPASPTPFM
jgi:4a-hydroxytetrahydrobiopterin dehydratase